MAYVIRQSRMRRLIALVSLGTGAAVTIPMLLAYLRASVIPDSGALGVVLPVLLAILAMALLSCLVWLCWRHEHDRQVCGIRLMGGACALLYFPARFSAPSSRTGASATVAPLASSLTPMHPPDVPFPYDGHPAMAVTVTRIVHWPGSLISLTFDTVRPVDPALDRVAGPRMAPRVRSWRSWSVRLLPRLMSYPRRRVVTTLMRPPRHLMIFADAMSAAQWRSLVISLACLQRGVTFVEHR